MDQEFNAQAFMQEMQEMPALDTKIDPIPPADYPGKIGEGDKDVDLVAGVKDGKPWMRLVCLIEITDPNLAAQLKRDTNPKVRYDCFIDLDATGRTDTRPQKNVKLGKLKDQAVTVKVGNRPDKDDPNTIYNEVLAVTRPR